MKSALFATLLAGLVCCQEVVYNDYSTEPQTKLDEVVADNNLQLELPICEHRPWMKDQPSTTLSLSQFDGRTNGGKFYITVVMTAYTGCNPARLDAPKYAMFAKKFQDEYDNVVALTSYKGGGDCTNWADLSEQEGSMPIYIQDDTRFLHYMFFSMHPQYAILDKNMKVRRVFTSDELDFLGGYVAELVEEADPVGCEVGAWGDWGECEVLQRLNVAVPCGDGKMTRTRKVLSGAGNCPALQEEQDCQIPCTDSQSLCVPQFGASAIFTANSDNTNGLLDQPWDLAFNPNEGKDGEIWVANHNTDSFTVLKVRDGQLSEATKLADRNPFHYMDQVSAFAWGRDGRVCTVQASLNTYDGLMEPNYFQGPTLYDTDPKYLVLANNSQGNCGSDGFYRHPQHPEHQCYLSHIDMLHEAPNARGVAYDPEDITPYANVFWVFDGNSSQLVRFDFEQPHGPGSMDHALASVRRYTDVLLTQHASCPSHMQVDHKSRQLYIADSGANRILVVNIESGKYLRDAREEYTSFSSQLPSFQYSIWGCTEYSQFAVAQTPSGLALTPSIVFVAEFETGKVLAFSKADGSLISSFSHSSLPPGVMSIALSLDLNTLWFAHTSNQIGYISNIINNNNNNNGKDNCKTPAATLSFAMKAEDMLSQSGESVCSKEYERSVALPSVIEHEAGYMNMDAITDTYVNLQCSEMNFDALLLAGYFCHRCLPKKCLNGGACVELKYVGFQCNCSAISTEDTEFYGDQCQFSRPFDPCACKTDRPGAMCDRRTSLCGSAQFGAWMDINCPSTCCRLSSARKCSDLSNHPNGQCEARQQYCSHPQAAPWMKSNCPATCCEQDKRCSCETNKDARCWTIDPRFCYSEDTPGQTLWMKKNCAEVCCRTPPPSN